MSIPTEMAALANTLSGITLPTTPLLPPIRRIYQVPPMSPPTTQDLPAFVIFIRRPIQIGVATFGNEQRTTEYIAQLIFTTIGQGDFTTNYNNVLYYIEPTLDALWSHIRLNNTNDVNWSIPTQTLMPSQLAEQWGGQEYYGIDFTVQTVSSRSIDIDN